jgi:hypothetical protein
MNAHDTNQFVAQKSTLGRLKKFGFCTQNKKENFV